jgi:hypothetical protein
MGTLAYPKPSINHVGYLSRLTLAGLSIYPFERSNVVPYPCYAPVLLIRRDQDHQEQAEQESQMLSDVLERLRDLED